ncbi:hypothetical protein NA78x_000485 [Anatilimnocola sp. NA78]|uniref:tetratricopeptide repeat protein n=1 Tax=Anatilimnocola sp. NA78 TaxID=3415683 RepID=UPI003CE55D6F
MPGYLDSLLITARGIKIVSPYRAWSIIAALLIAAPLAAKEEPAEPTEPEIAVAVKELGHDEYPIREAASKKLWLWGLVSQKALQQASKSNDAEVRLRARLILDKFELGLTPDSPPEFEALLSSFRDGDIESKRGILNSLIGEKKVKLAFKLARSEKNAVDRESLFSSASRTAQRFVPDLLVEDELDEAEAILESLDVAQDSSLERLTSMLLVTGRLPARLADLEKQFAKGSTFALAKRLVYYRRANGDLAGAADLAGKHQLAYYQRAILMEQSDWGAAAAVQQEMFKGPKLAAETLALGATLNFLAGNHVLMDSKLQELRANAPEQRSTYWDAAEAHLACEQHEHALRLLEESIPAGASYIRFLRFEYQESQAIAGLTAETRFDEAWLKSLIDGGKVATQKSVPRHDYARDLARQLHQLGERERAKQIVAVLRAAAEKDPSLWHTVIQADVLTGDRPQALDDLNTALEVPGTSPSPKFSALYGKDFALAETLYSRLGGAADRRRLTIATIEKILGPAGVPAEMKDPLTKQIAEDLEPWFEGADFRQQLRAGEVLVKLGDRKQARRWFEKAAPSATDAQLRLGDLAREDQDWPEAIRWYRAATEKLPALPLPRYLLGHAMLQAGDKDAGKLEQQRASLAALSPVARYSLAFQLKDRDLLVDAAEQARIVQITANPTVQHPTLAAGHLRANCIFTKEPSEAADNWQRWLLSQLVGVNNFTLFEHYLTDPEVIHRNRGRAFLAAGKPDLAIAELKRVLAIMPGNVRALEEFVPLLSKAERTKEAGELVSEVASRYERVIRDYPQTSYHRRELALLLARCNQRLDEALALAQAAVKLEDQTAANHAALAEIHSLRGENALAVASAQRALELQANNEELRERLAKWKGK